MTKPSQIIRLANRGYRALLWLYPPRFRREYGGEMAQLFADLSRDAEKRHGAWGVFGLLVRAAFDTIYNSIGEWTMTLRQHWSRTLITLTGLAALVAVWVFMYLSMIVYTSLFLVPWDAMLSRPVEGSLAQIANDFFNGPGAFILSFVVLAINAALLARAIHAGADAAALLWKFAIAGLVFIGVSWALAAGVGIYLSGIVWPHPVGRSDPGFHRSVFPVLMWLLSYLLYLKLLMRFGRQDDTSAGFGATPVY
jgi:hypothetical protein